MPTTGGRGSGRAEVRDMGIHGHINHASLNIDYTSKGGNSELCQCN